MAPAAVRNNIKCIGSIVTGAARPATAVVSTFLARAAGLASAGLGAGALDIGSAGSGAGAAGLGAGR